MLTKKDLMQITSIVRDEIKPVKMAVAKLDKKIDKVQKTSEAGIKILDRDYVHTKKRVDRIEEHLDLPPLPRKI